MRLIGLVLLVSGALGLIYGGFSYTQDKTALKVGPLALTVKEQKTVDIPLWASGGAVIAGAALVLLGGKRR